jgi:hypothetical protein
VKFVVLVSVVALVGAALAVTGAIVVNRNLSSPEGLVRSYFAALESGDAASARALPGVISPKKTREELLLLQTGAYRAPSDIVVSEAKITGEKATVTASFVVDDKKERATFTFAAEPSLLGIFEQWRFAEPPLGSLHVEVAHDTSIQVGDIGDVDFRSYPGANVTSFSADATFAVFIGAGYDVYRASSLLTAPHSIVIVDDVSRHDVALNVSATPRFVDQVQKKVDKALADCVAQTVLMPTGCPFGYATENRWVGDASWSLTTNPRLALLPGDESWLATGTGVAHISGTVQSLFDGSSSPVEADREFHMAVPVWVTGPDAFVF